MFELLLEPEYLPFSAALLLMIMIGAVEAIGLGASAVHLDVDSGGGDLLGWLGVGQVPLLVLLLVLLACFGVAGLLLQQVVSAVAGSPLSPWLAAPAALLVSLPLTGLLGRGLARILPHDETTAVELDSLIGKRATVTIGVARRGCPAQARVRDVHGQSHYVMMEPTDDRQSVAAGETVLLVRREGGIFIGLAEGEPLTGRLDQWSAIGSSGSL